MVVQLPYLEALEITAHEAGILPAWLCAVHIGTYMLKIENIYGLYELGRRLQELNDKLSSKYSLGEIAINCEQVKQGLAYLLNDHVLPLRSSKESATKLFQSICDMTTAGQLKQNWQEPLNSFYTQPIAQNIANFQGALSEEVRQIPLFFVDAEGNLSTDKLLKGAHDGYPSHVKTILTQLCKDEIDEAGRCLVFERATASGFHILRSVEIVVKQYLAMIPGFTIPPLNRNWGEYIKLLSSNGADTKVTDHLQRIKDNYRNPLMHPEDTLELHEAASLFAVCQSMTESIVADMKKRGFIQ